MVNIDPRMNLKMGGKSDTGERTEARNLLSVFCRFHGSVITSLGSARVLNYFHWPSKSDPYMGGGGWIVATWIMSEKMIDKISFCRLHRSHKPFTLKHY